MSFALAAALLSADPIRVGIVGLDTSHAPAFAKALLDPAVVGPGRPFRVESAFPGGSEDIPSSRDRVEGFTKELETKHNVTMLKSIPLVVERSDAILLESVDGRPHLGQFHLCAGQGKPVFIDKPVAHDLADAVAIFMLAEQTKTPVFSSSSLRYSPGIAGAAKNPKFGGVQGCVAYSPCTLEAHHADLFWYGIHGTETLFTIMGTGCKSVVRTHTPDADVVTGVWADGRVGTFHGIRKGRPDYGALVFGAKGNGDAGKFGGYEPLVTEIAGFFRTKLPPVSPAETLEIYTFMAAADASKAKGGASVTLAETLEKAKGEALKRLSNLPSVR